MSTSLAASRSRCASRAALCSLLLVAGAGCTPGMRVARPDEALGKDEVLLMGRAQFDPPLYAGDKGPMWDVAGVMDKVVLGFTFTPDKPVSDQGDGIELYASALPGEPFAVVAPRRTLYLRLVYMVPEAARTGHKEITAYYYSCLTRRALEVPAGAEALYLGTVTCLRDRKPGVVRVTDEWGSTRKALAPHVQGREVTKLLAE
jgi:hypothetical protein